MQLTAHPSALCAPCASLRPVRRTRGPAPARASVDSPERTSTSSTPSDDKLMPDWAGDKLLSRVVNAAINFPPLFSVMKVGARAAIKGTAEKRSVPWAGNVSTLESTTEVYKIKEEIEDPNLVYPSYYTQPFHGYDTGNLSWQAAFEVEPASDAMALRVWKEETELTPMAAQTRLRMAILDAAADFIKQHNLETPSDILDIGSSVGVSTRWLAHYWPAAQVTGLDLSPYFLAVAELRERQAEAGAPAGDGLVTPGSAGGGATPTPRKRIKFIHANMECSGLPDASYDMVSVQFVTHECPAAVLTNICREATRLVRPGGVVLFADNNPRSKVIQNLPPVLFTLMKSTEPWSDEYYAYDLEDGMRAAGLQGVVTVESDPRHRAVLGYKTK
jgi:SAM-dependent methyltransferase